MTDVLLFHILNRRGERIGIVNGIRDFFSVLPSSVQSSLKKIFNYIFMPVTSNSTYFRIMFYDEKYTFNTESYRRHINKMKQCFDLRGMIFGFLVGVLSLSFNYFIKNTVMVVV